MDKLLSVAQIVIPIFAVICLGMLARRRKLLTPEQIRGVQQFVVQFCLPCMLFNACLNCSFGAESAAVMALLLFAMLCSSLFGFHGRKHKYPYHNYPYFFSSQETGMLGIPLFMTLFGADQAYRMGIMDMGQALVSILVLALLSAAPTDNPTPAAIAGRVFRSPLLIMSVLALALNLTGLAAWLNTVGIGPIITGTTEFMAAPVSAAMLFSVGYNFSLGSGSRRLIFKICGIHLAVFGVILAVIQAALLLVPGVDALTRWAVLLYCALPASYLTPSLGRTAEDASIAAGVCSVLTVFCLAVFCVAAAIIV